MGDLTEEQIDAHMAECEEAYQLGLVEGEAKAYRYLRGIADAVRSRQDR